MSESKIDVYPISSVVCAEPREVPIANRGDASENSHLLGVLAQLVERLNGIEEVRGSIPLGSRFKGDKRGPRSISGRFENHLAGDHGHDAARL